MASPASTWRTVAERVSRVGVGVAELLAGRRHGGAAQLAVMVPTMFGWTTHRNVYSPAGRPGTSYVVVATPVKMSPWKPGTRRSRP